MLSRRDLNSVIDNAHSAASDVLDDGRYQAKRTVKKAFRRADEFTNDVRDRIPTKEDIIGRVLDTAKRLVNERPASSLAAVGVLGLIVGLSARSRR